MNFACQVATSFGLRPLRPWCLQLCQATEHSACRRFAAFSNESRRLSEAGMLRQCGLRSGKRIIPPDLNDKSIMILEHFRCNVAITSKP